MSSNLDHVYLKSCAGLNLGAEFSIHLVIFSFHMALNIFFSIVSTRLGFLQPTSCDMAYYICDQTINSMGNLFFQCSYGGGAL